MTTSKAYRSAILDPAVARHDLTGALTLVQPNAKPQTDKHFPSVTSLDVLLAYERLLRAMTARSIITQYANDRFAPVAVVPYPQHFLLIGDAYSYRRFNDCLVPELVPQRRQLLRGRLIAPDLSFSDRADLCRCCWLRGPFPDRSKARHSSRNRRPSPPRDKCSCRHR